VVVVELEPQLEQAAELVQGLRAMHQDEKGLGLELLVEPTQDELRGAQVGKEP